MRLTIGRFRLDDEVQDEGARAPSISSGSCDDGCGFRVLHPIMFIALVPRHLKFLHVTVVV